MADINAPKVNLWRESWSAFLRNMRTLLPLILAFTFLIGICDFYTLPDQLRDFNEKSANIQKQMDAMSDPTQDLAAQIKVIQNQQIPEHVVPPVVRAANICAMFLYMIALYYMLTAFLKREPASRLPAQNLQTFFTWIFQMALTTLCILGIMLLTAMVSGLLLSFIFPGSNGAILGASVLAMLASLYAATRFTLVGSLAISGVAKPIKAAWQMSKGQVWRLMWGLLMIASVVSMILMAIFLVPVAALVAYTPATPDSLVFIGGMSAIWAFFGVATLASVAVFCGVSYRVLLKEQGLQATSESGSIVI